MEHQKSDEQLSAALRIAVVEPVGGHGGMDYYDFGLCGGLTSAGVDVVLHTCDETPFPLGADFEVRHTFAGVYGREATWRRGIRFVWGSVRAIFSSVIERRKIVHFHFFRVSVLQAMQVLLARLFMRKVVITAHDVESFVERLEVPKLSRMAYKLSHRVVAHNQVSKTELVGRIGLSVEKIAVIPHGNYLHAITEIPSQATARINLGLDNHSKVLLFFGQIKDVKGLDLLIEAMPSVIKAHPEVVLLIGGKPWKSDFSKYERLIDEAGIRDKCIMHIRFIPDSEVASYYSASDLVVLPYRRIYQSGVLLMAMSYGKPVLVSDLPGMLEMVNDGENGFVFKQGDSHSLGKRLNEALADSVLLDSVARCGRDMIEEKYGWDVIGRQTAGAYEGIRGFR